MLFKNRSILIIITNIIAAPLLWLGERYSFFHRFQIAEGRVKSMFREAREVNSRLEAAESKTERKKLAQEFEAKRKQCINGVCVFLAKVTSFYIAVIFSFILLVNLIGGIANRVEAFSNAHWSNRVMVFGALIMFGFITLSYLYQKFMGNRALQSMTEAQVKATHAKLREILLKAVIPIAVSIGLRPPIDLSELVPNTGVLHHEQAENHIFYISFPIANDTEDEELDKEDIVYTLNRRLHQMNEANQLAFISVGGVIDSDSGAFICPIKVERVSIFAKNVIAEVSILGG